MKLTKVLFSLTAIGAALALASCAKAQTNTAQMPTNIALHKKVTTSEPSNYSLTKDKNPLQLTDGKYAGDEYSAEHKARSLWIQEGALTWRTRKEPVVIMIDLEEVSAISGVSFSTAAGAASVQFPSFIGISVSEDAKNWYYQGNLVTHSLKNSVPDLSEYSKFRFSTHDLKTKGRYLALTVIQTPYTVVDEIEVYGGEVAWLSRPAGGERIVTLGDVLKIAESTRNSEFARRRVINDIREIRKSLNNSEISAAQKSTWETRLEKASRENDEFEAPKEGVKTILPINDAHRDALAVYGEVLTAQGVKPLTIWKQHRYDWTPFLAKPTQKENAELKISMLKDQFRSDALLLTNASNSEKTMQLQLQNPPKDAQPGWLKIDLAVWTDTYQGIPVTDALLPIGENQGNYELKVPAGFTGKVWLTVDSSKVVPGSYQSTLEVDKEKVPLRLEVASVTMERPRLSLGMWDYTDPVSMNRSASRGVNSKNYADALKLMKSHYVDSPWATRSILPWPQAEDFDAQNNLKAALDFTDLNAWIAQWPEARQFFVYINAKEKTDFVGAQRGTPEFDARLGSWAKAIDEHIKSQGLKPKQLSWLINDEPGLHGSWQDDVTADWARAIKRTTTHIGLVSDPVWKRPDQQKNQEAFALMDILVPNTQNYTSAVPEVHKYFEEHREKGKDLWLYACIGPVRLFNPQQYYRSQAWRVFSMGGKGMGYWAFGDIRGAPTTWHDYEISESFTPAFIDKDKVYSSIHWDSVREGVQDFEELSMLHDAIHTTRNTTLKTQAQKILDEAVETVISIRTNDRWYNETNPELTDFHLQKVREMLGKLNNIS